MQFKFLFLIASAVSAVFATSTVSELTAGVTDIDSKIATLQSRISSFPKTGGTYNQALSVHNQVDVVVDAVRLTVMTAKGFDGPVSYEDGKNILDYFHGMVPVIKSGLDALMEKKDALLALGIGRMQSVISLDLEFLKQAVIDLESGLIAIAPHECIDEATSVAAEVKAAVEVCIRAFAAA